MTSRNSGLVPFVIVLSFAWCVVGEPLAQLQGWGFFSLRFADEGFQFAEALLHVLGQKPEL
jgi:hypothetical protein